MRRSYPKLLTVNGVRLRRVEIDPHYELRHRSSMSDGLILELVMSLDGEFFLPVDRDDNGFEYFVFDGILKGKGYRLIWCWPASREYLGVINAYRRSHERRR